VTSIATDATDDAGSVVLLLGTVKFAMADLAAVLASLVLIVTQCPVQGRELTELVTLELILPFRYGSSLSTVSYVFIVRF